MTRGQLIFQRDGSVLVTAGTGRHELADLIRSCARLRLISGDSYVYEISDAALWGAASRGIDASGLLAALERVATTPVPAVIAARIAERMSRFGAIWIAGDEDQPKLCAHDRSLFDRLGIKGHSDPSDGSIAIRPEEVPTLKLQAVSQGWPIDDRRASTSGISENARFTMTTELRAYQRAAVDSAVRAGSGIVLLPCGAGKTLVGLAVAASVAGSVLVLSPSRSVSEQWCDAFMRHTSVEPEAVSVLDRSRSTTQITIATYHAATMGKRSADLQDRRWDLVIYDEVQSLPASVFRATALFQTTHRLGLTATLVREDGKEAEAIALVGPPVYDASWLTLEQSGWIAPATCLEVRVPLADFTRDHLRFKIAALERLLLRHECDPTLVMGTDVLGLRTAGRHLGFPVLTGETPAMRREEVLESFRSGYLRVLGMSRIGTLGIDLPTASVLIQLSGSFGSRQEEAQRLGRLLRPAPGKQSTFYTLVAVGTREVSDAARRQRFLVNQGYRYHIVDAAELQRPGR